MFYFFEYPWASEAGTAIAKEMSYASGLQKQALFSIALVLFVFIMGINILLNVVLKGGKRDE